MVMNDQVDDAQAIVMSKEIARAIENEATYPGPGPRRRRARDARVRLRALMTLVRVRSIRPSPTSACSRCSRSAASSSRAVVGGPIASVERGRRRAHEHDPQGHARGRRRCSASSTTPAAATGSRPSSTTLTLLHGTVPVPEVVHVDDERLVIVYRWIDGITLARAAASSGDRAAFASLAEPLGRVLALARDAPTRPSRST